MSQAFYRKWRPHRWEQVVGQEHVIRTLRNAVTSDRVAHAYLFAGPRGTGKTSTARLLAKAVNCLDEDLSRRPCERCDHCQALNAGRFLDLIEIDAASNTSVDDVRDLRDKINFSPNQGRYKIYVVDECFRYEDLITLADGSKLPIGKIVEECLNVEVLSYNEQTRHLEAKTVVRHMRKTPQLPMVRIVFDNNRSLTCTINHKFYTPRGQIRAGELDVGHFVYANYERITQHQLSVVAGAALGDGHLALTGSQMRARLSTTQGAAQKEYLEYKIHLLGNLVETPMTFSNFRGTFSENGTYRVATLSRPQIAELQHELYCRGRKRISLSFLERITPLGLAIWYMDDGSLTTQHNYYHCKDGHLSSYPATRSTLSVHGLTIEEAELIVDWLCKKWNISGGVTKTAKGPVIWLTLEGTARLHQLIAPYVPPSMDYKLLAEYRNKFCPPSDDGKLGGLAVSVVKSIERVPSTKFVYNIEVADNHNYFARDILVANCHMLSGAAFNALLKTLEEPPAHAIFVLATTEVHKIPATVLSRCQRHEFRRIPVTDIVTLLEQVAEKENLQVDRAALALIARQATGSLRDAISLLDQLASTADAITLEVAQDVLGTAASQAVIDLVDALLARESAAGLDHLHRTLDAGSDPRQFARQVVDYLRSLLLIHVGNAEQVDATPEVRVQMARHAQAFGTQHLLSVIRAFNHAANDARGAWQPALPLEMAFVESLDLPQQEAAVAEPAAATPQKASESGRKLRPQSATPPPASLAGAREEEAPLDPEQQRAQQELTQNWNQILSLVRADNPNTYGLLNSCKLRHLKGNLLILGFASDVLKNQMTKPENLKIVENALSEVLERKVSVRCVISTARRISVPPEVDSDGMVAAALRDLGGEIVDIQ